MIGLPVSNRTGSVLARLPVTAVNVVPLRIAVDEREPVGDLLRRVVKTLRRQRRHQRYRGEQLRRDLGLFGHGKRLVGPQLNIKPFTTRLTFGECEGTVHSLAAGAVEDLTVTVSGQGGPDGLTGLGLVVDGNPEVYGTEELDTHLHRFAALLDRLSRCATDTPVGRLALVDGAERHRILEEFNAPADDDAPAPTSSRGSRNRPGAPRKRWRCAAASRPSRTPDSPPGSTGWAKSYGPGGPGAAPWSPSRCPGVKPCW